MDPNVPVQPTPQRPAAFRPPRADEPEEERRPASAPAQEVPRRAAPARQPLNLEDVPLVPERHVYRRAATATAGEPVQQIKALPLKLTVQTYLNHVSEGEFERSIKEIAEARHHFLRQRPNQPQPPVQPHMSAAHAAGSNNKDVEWSSMEYQRPPHFNVQRDPVSTTMATVPVIINGVIFEEGVIDTGTTNTLISQTTARQLGMLHLIEPCHIKFSCADGKSSMPWGRIKRLNVGVEGLVIPLDVYVSGATTYDVLIGTDWLTQARAVISFDRAEMSVRIDPYTVGRIPILTVPKASSLYTSFDPGPQVHDFTLYSGGEDRGGEDCAPTVHMDAKAVCAAEDKPRGSDLCGPSNAHPGWESVMVSEKAIVPSKAVPSLLSSDARHKEAHPVLEPWELPPPVKSLPWQDDIAIVGAVSGQDSALDFKEMGHVVNGLCFVDRKALMDGAPSDVRGGCQAQDIHNIEKALPQNGTHNWKPSRTPRCNFKEKDKDQGCVPWVALWDSMPINLSLHGQQSLLYGKNESALFMRLPMKGTKFKSWGYRCPLISLLDTGVLHPELVS